MQKYYADMTALDNDVKRFIKNKPHAAPLFKAFAPVIRLKCHLLGSNLLQESFYEELDFLQLQAGLPLLHGHIPHVEQKTLKEAAMSVLSAIRQGFPESGNEVDMISKYLLNNPIDSTALFSPISVPSLPLEPAGSEAAAVSAPVIKLFSELLCKTILADLEYGVSRQLSDTQWTKGYCPVCGSLPLLSISTEKGQPRLYCGMCGHEWRFSWAKCPACEHESPEEAFYFFVEGDKDEKVFTCHNCHKYLLSIREYEGSCKVVPELLAMSMAHLDIIAQEKGFKPMMFCEWNNFAG